jgi:hypothetical protein
MRCGWESERFDSFLDWFRLAKGTEERIVIEERDNCQRKLFGRIMTIEWITQRWDDGAIRSHVRRRFSLRPKSETLRLKDCSSIWLDLIIPPGQWTFSMREQEMNSGSLHTILQLQRGKHPEMNFQNGSNEELIQESVWFGYSGPLRRSTILLMLRRGWSITVRSFVMPFCQV